MIKYFNRRRDWKSYRSVNENVIDLWSQFGVQGHSFGVRGSLSADAPISSPIWPHFGDQFDACEKSVRMVKMTSKRGQNAKNRDFGRARLRGFPGSLEFGIWKSPFLGVGPHFCSDFDLQKAYPRKTTFWRCFGGGLKKKIYVSEGCGQTPHRCHLSAHFSQSTDRWIDL